MGTTTPAKQEIRHNYWQKHIRRWKRSGLSQRRYCREHAISVSAFYYWHRKLKEQPKAEQPQFYPLALPNVLKTGDNDTGSGLRLFLHERRYCIDIEKEFSATSLKKLIATIEGCIERVVLKHFIGWLWLEWAIFPEPRRKRRGKQNDIHPVAIGQTNDVSGSLDPAQLFGQVQLYCSQRVFQLHCLLSETVCAGYHGSGQSQGAVLPF
jgi:hypothetical protein